MSSSYNIDEILLKLNTYHKVDFHSKSNIRNMASLYYVKPTGNSEYVLYYIDYNNGSNVVTNKETFIEDLLNSTDFMAV